MRESERVRKKEERTSQPLYMFMHFTYASQEHPAQGPIFRSTKSTNVGRGKGT